MTAVPHVAITGVGIVGPHGLGRAPLAEALARGRARAVPIDRSQGYHRVHGATQAALLADENLARWVSPAAARRMSRLSKLAVAAARLALEDAAWSAPQGGDGAAVVMATVYGPALFTEKLLSEILVDPETASPFLFTECVANAPAAEVALGCAARGPNLTITQREAGPLVAVGRAACEVREGRAPRALTGTVEEMTPLLHASLDHFHALARAHAGSPRPFDRDRDGFLAGEGAVVLVLEPEDAAATRGGRVIARIAASGSAFDPTATPSAWGSGHAALGAAIAASLERHGVGLDTIGAIVSGASGSRGGDRLEALALRATWGEAPLPPVLAPKGVTGEYGGGQLAAALLALEGARFGALEAFASPDTEIGVVPHGGAALAGLGRVLVTAFAAGGAAAWLVLERP